MDEEIIRIVIIVHYSGGRALFLLDGTVFAFFRARSSSPIHIFDCCFDSSVKDPCFINSNIASQKSPGITLLRRSQTIRNFLTKRLT